MASDAHFLFPLVVLSLLLLPYLSYGADPGPLQDFCVADLSSTLFINGYPCTNSTEVTSDDFFYSAFGEDPTDFDDYGLSVTPGTVNEFPGLNTLGVSINRCTLLPGGNTQYRTNPRGSSLVMVTEGEMYAGFFATSGILYSKTMTVGDLLIIPPGLMHFGINTGEGNVTFYASLNSHNAGGQLVGQLNPNDLLKSKFPTIKLARF